MNTKEVKLMLGTSICFLAMIAFNLETDKESVDSSSQESLQTENTHVKQRALMNQG